MPLNFCQFSSFRACPLTSTWGPVTPSSILSWKPFLCQYHAWWQCIWIKGFKQCLLALVWCVGGMKMCGCGVCPAWANVWHKDGQPDHQGAVWPDQPLSFGCWATTSAATPTCSTSNRWGGFVCFTYLGWMLTCHVTVGVGDLGLCCCVQVTSLEH